MFPGFLPCQIFCCRCFLFFRLFLIYRCFLILPVAHTSSLTLLATRKRRFRSDGTPESGRITPFLILQAHISQECPCIQNFPQSHQPKYWLILSNFGAFFWQNLVSKAACVKAYNCFIILKFQVYGRNDTEGKLNGWRKNKHYKTGKCLVKCGHYPWL